MQDPSDQDLAKTLARSRALIDRVRALTDQVQRVLEEDPWRKVRPGGPLRRGPRGGPAEP